MDWLTMSNIIKFNDLQNIGIRVTDDSRYSVFDVIAFCGKKNPRQTWESLTNQFSEVVQKTDNYKFPGKGQRLTPVANRENILYIIGLLPGAIGRSYREASAKIFLQYLDASPELAESIIDRSTPENLKRIERRIEGKKVRHLFTAELTNRGVNEGKHIATCTNAIYRPLLGGTAKDIKEKRNLPANSSLRDSMSSLELSAIAFAEELAVRDMKDVNAHGFYQCHDVTKDAANRVKKAMD